MMLHAVLTLVVNVQLTFQNELPAGTGTACSAVVEDWCYNNMNYGSECEAIRALEEQKLKQHPTKGKCYKCSTEPAPVCVDSVTYFNECERMEAEIRAHVEWVKANENKEQFVAWQPSAVSWGACKTFKLQKVVKVCPDDYADGFREVKMTLPECALTCQDAKATSFLYEKCAKTECTCVCQKLNNDKKCTKKQIGFGEYIIKIDDTITKAVDWEEWSEWSTCENSRNCKGFRNRMAQQSNNSWKPWSRQQVEKVKLASCSFKQEPVCMNGMTYSSDCRRQKAENKRIAAWVEENENKKTKKNWVPSSLSEGACPKLEEQDEQEEHFATEEKQTVGNFPSTGGNMLSQLSQWVLMWLTKMVPKSSWAWDMIQKLLRMTDMKEENEM